MPDETRGPGRPRKNIVLGEAEDVAAEVVDTLKAEAPAVEKEVVATAEGKETIGEALQHSLGDAEGAVVDTTPVERVTAGIEAAEHVALTTVEHIADEHVPVLAPYIDEIEPEVETRVFVVTNLVTSDFAHLGETYIVVLEKAATEKLHDAALKAALEARILEAKGVRLLSNALHYLEVTTAKFLHAE